MQQTNPYKLQLNVELSRTNMIELLAQLSTLAVNTTGNATATTPSPPEPNTSSKSLEMCIVSLFHQIGIPAHIVGYQYLMDALLITIEEREVINSITKMLYPEIASRNNTTPSRVERSIRHAINIAFTRGNLPFIKSLFKYDINPNTGRPTNSEFIAVLADNLRMNFRNAF